MVAPCIPTPCRFNPITSPFYIMANHGLAGSGNARGRLGLDVRPGSVRTIECSRGLLLYPSRGNHDSNFTVSWDMDFNGMVVLADGRALVNGEDRAYDPFQGSPKSPASIQPRILLHCFQYGAALVSDPDDARRWPGDDILGADENGNTTPKVEIYTDGSGWGKPIKAPFTT